MNAPYDKLHETIEEMATPDVPWANSAVAFVAMKKRASVEPEPVVPGLSEEACSLLNQMIAEKLALKTAAAEHGLDKLAEDEAAHARFFARQAVRFQGADWELPLVPEGTKLASMMERSITIGHHLCAAVGNDPMRHTVEAVLEHDVQALRKVAQLEQTNGQVKKASITKKAVDLARLKGRIKQAQHSGVSGGALRGPEGQGMRPRHEIRDGAQYLYYDAKDSGHPKGSEKKAAKGANISAPSDEWNQLAGAGIGAGTAVQVEGLLRSVKDLKEKARHATAQAKSGIPRISRKVPEAAAGKVRGKGRLLTGLGLTSAGIAAGYKAHKEREKEIKAGKRKKSSLAVAKVMKLAAEAGMSVEEYLGAEQQAQQAMEANELEHTKSIAENAVAENQQLAERAMMAEQQLAGLQQQNAMSQQQAQMAMQQAADSEANAAEQANAKLRMKMKIDQMRQSLADIAAVNPQMDEVGPEPGMPQPGAPASPLQQQLQAEQQGAAPPMTAASAQEQQQAQQAQDEAAQQTAQAQQKQQEDAARMEQAQQVGAAQMPLNAGMQGAPAVAPAQPAM